MPRLLIVSNTPSDNTRLLADAVLAGARDRDIDNVSVEHREPLDTDADHVLSADGIIIGTTENFGYMAGLIKDFFERTYYPCLEETQALPYALYVRAGNDGEGTIRAVERIITGLRWKPICPPLLMRGSFDDSFVEQCRELGMLMAAGLDAGIY